MREYMKDSSLIAPLTPFSAAIDGAKVAEQILLGVIHEDKDLKDGAIRHYQQADSIETRMVYNEPRDWLLSPKHYLGRALLNAGKWKEAEKIFLQDLAYNNENGWSLVGLYHSLSAQKKQNEAGQVMSRYKRAFSKADIQVNVSAY
jgi:tetratricopeptide (TPR) repeat protein